MSIFDLFRKQPTPAPRPYTPPPPPKMIRESFRLDDQDRVIVEARTLLDLERVKPRVQDVHSIISRVKACEARQSEDGAKVDNDPRPGHVLTPDFSYHPDTGKFRLTGDRAIEGDAHTVTYKDWFESAVWNRQQHTVTLTYQEGANGAPRSGPPPQVKPRENEVLSQQSYPKEAAPQRVRDLLEAASLWQKQSLALDGLAGVDFHPEAARVVAPQVPPELIQGTVRLQLLVGKSEGCEMLKVHVDGENLQLQGFSPTGAPVQLGATRDPEGNYEVTFLQARTYHYPSDNSAERVIVSKDTGSLVYQTLKYTDPDGQYA